jgi:hypothetical protein
VFGRRDALALMAALAHTMKVPLAGGAPTTLATGGLEIPLSIAVGATSVYWAAQEENVLAGTIVGLTPK